MHTVKEIQHYFEKNLNGIFTPQEKRQLAKQFLSHYLNCEPSQLFLKGNDVTSDAFFKKVNESILAINSGEPTHYVLGTTYFYGLQLKVDRRALIPRPETEELVDWIRQSITVDTSTILDVGTGSGCIALALQSVWPKTTVWGVDKSELALELAKENAQILKVTTHFEQADALDLTRTIDTEWDVIVSNPPYVPRADKSKMQAHVVDYEPHEALFVEDHQPFIFYEAIGRYAFNHLKPNGQLFFEINEDFPQEIRKILLQIGFSKVLVQKDLQGKERMVRALL